MGDKIFPVYGINICIWYKYIMLYLLQLCITLNNIEHVRQYLTELPQLLEWDSVTLLISTKHESEDVGQRAVVTLSRLLDTADREILLKGRLLLMQIMERMKVDVSRFMEIFTQQTPEKAAVSKLILQEYA